MRLSGAIGKDLQPKTPTANDDLVRELTRQILQWLDASKGDKDPVNALIYASYAAAWIKVIKITKGENAVVAVARVSFAELEEEVKTRQLAAAGAIPLGDSSESPTH